MVMTIFERVLAEFRRIESHYMLGAFAFVDSDGNQ